MRRPRTSCSYPDSVSFETAALLACSGMSVVHASRLAGVALGDTVVVNGVGGVGLMAIQVANAARARTIAIADSEGKPRRPRRSARPRPSSSADGEGYEDVPERIRDLTGGAGADHYVELSGRARNHAGRDPRPGTARKSSSSGYTDAHSNLSDRADPVEIQMRSSVEPAASRRDLVICGSSSRRPDGSR